MTTFAEELTAVRKERHITQEQLANEMNVSRSAISHWENGRFMPDLDTIKHLSQVLDHNFLTVEGMNTEEQSESETEEIPETPATEQDVLGENATISTLPKKINVPVKKPNFRILIPAVLGGVLLCAVLIVFLLMNGRPSREQANVLITATENPVYAIRFDEFPDGVGWFWGFTMKETAGVPFTVQELNAVFVSDNGQEFLNTYSGQQCAEYWGSDTLTQGIPQTWTGGFPLQNLCAIRLTISGVDANGNALAFEGSLELSKEIVE